MFWTEAKCLDFTSWQLLYNLLILSKNILFTESTSHRQTMMVFSNSSRKNENTKY